jgi:hypothetical protein
LFDQRDPTPITKKSALGTVVPQWHDYPGAGTIPTMGMFSGRPPIEPSYPALPNAKMPPSAATSQYPLRTVVAVPVATDASKFPSPE